LTNSRFVNSDLELFYDEFLYTEKYVNGIPFKHSFYSNVSEFKAVPSEQFNYAFNEELARAIDDIIRETNTKGITQQQVSMFSTRIKNKKNKFKFDIDYVMQQLSDSIRFDKILTESKESLKESIVNLSLLENTKIRSEFIEILRKDADLIEDVRNKLLQEEDKITLKIQELSEQKEEAQLEYSKIKNEIELAKQERTKIDKDKEAEAIEDLKKEQTLLNQEIESLQSKIEVIKNNHDELFKASDLKNTIKELGEKQFLASTNYDNKVNEVSEKQKILDDLKKEITAHQQKSSEEYKKGLLEVKNSIDVLTQFDDKDTKIEFPYIENIEDLSQLSKIEDLVSYIQFLQIRLSEQDRDISIEHIINLLTCIDLSFITIFSGLPGTGKTSLATILGNDVIGARFAPIQVGRGWTSDRDLFGYFNPITNSFISSGTGLYEYLSEIEKDKRLNLVLLDEANLSPIEHYWSKFMGLTDEFIGKEIKFTNSNSVTLNNSLRFIATINNDMTTEPVSPRLLDRAPCIRLDIYSRLDAGSKIGLDQENETLVSSLIEKFGGRPILSSSLQNMYLNCRKNMQDETLGKMLEIVDKVRDILIIRGSEEKSFGASIHLSARRIRMIKKYLKQSTGIYSEFSKHAQEWLDSDRIFWFLDFALAQFILPLVSGHGKAFKDRLTELKTYLSTTQQIPELDLPISTELLNMMILQGAEDLDTYDFMSLR
jgi:hypothetical protein